MRDDLVARLRKAQGLTRDNLRDIAWIVTAWIKEAADRIEADAADIALLIRRRENSDAELERLRASLSQGEPSNWTANCCQCGRIVDTREKAEGGDPFGCQLDDKRWTCSPQCWERVVDPASPQPLQGAVPDGWRSMESAPKDGSAILVSGGVARWYQGAWHTITGEPYPGRWIEWHVTAWMPIPKHDPASPPPPSLDARTVEAAKQIEEAKVFLGKIAIASSGLRLNAATRSSANTLVWKLTDALRALKEGSLC